MVELASRDPTMYLMINSGTIRRMWLRGGVEIETIIATLTVGWSQAKINLASRQCSVQSVVQIKIIKHLHLP